MRPPRFVYFFGVFRNSTISFSSSFGFVDAGDVGEAHLHFVVGVDLRAAARERHHAAFGAAHAAEEEAPDRRRRRRSGMIQPRRSGSQWLTTSPVYLTPLASSSSVSFGSSTRVVVNCLVGLPSLPGVLLQRAADRLIADRRPRRPGRSCTSDLNSQYGNRPAGRREVVHLRDAEQRSGTRARTRAATTGARSAAAGRGDRRRAD